MRTVRRIRLRHGRRNNTAQKIARRSRFLVSSTHSALVCEWDQHPIGLVYLRGFSSNITHPIWTSQASESSVIRFLAYGSGSADGEITLYWRLSIASISFSFSMKFMGWYVCRFSFNGSQILAKFDTTRLKPLYTLSDDFKLETSRRAFSSSMASVICNAIYKRLR